MEINQEIYEKAKAITKKDVQLREYIYLCHSAKVCPKCGDTLDLETRYGAWTDTFVYTCTKCGYNN